MEILHMKFKTARTKTRVFLVSQDTYQSANAISPSYGLLSFSFLCFFLLAFRASLGIKMEFQDGFPLNELSRYTTPQSCFWSL